MKKGFPSALSTIVSAAFVGSAVAATARASFHLYNNSDDIAALKQAVEAAIDTFGRR